MFRRYAEGHSPDIPGSGDHVANCANPVYSTVNGYHHAPGESFTQAEFDDTAARTHAMILESCHDLEVMP